VRQRARLFSDLVAAGHRPGRFEFASIVAAARVTGLLQDPAVLTASRWQDWLHPRGKDGKFIVKESWVNVFGDGANGRLDDPHARRRRAKITRLTPQGAYVSYFDAIHPDANGKPTPITVDEAAGYPGIIPVDQLADKIATAPQPKAHLTPEGKRAPDTHTPMIEGQSAHDEFHGASYTPAKSLEQYGSAISTFNREITTKYGEKYGDQEQVIQPGQGPIPGGVTGDAFKAHASYVNQVSDDAIGAGLSFDKALKDSNGLWSEEAHQFFEQTVHEVFLAVTQNETKPKNRRAIMLGGMPGAGKTTTLKAMQKARMLRREEWVTANPDDFKEAMLQKGMFPNVAGLSPAETASLLHEASSEMNHMLEQLLITEGYNVVFDITMGGRERDGEEHWVANIVKGLKTGNGYKVDGIFVDIPPATSATRAALRHQAGLDALRQGFLTDGAADDAVQFGGRVVPPSLIAKNTLKPGDPLAEKFNSVNAMNFDAIKPVFQRWAMWDNSGEQPKFLDGTAATVADVANMPGFYPTEEPAPGVSASMVADLQPEEGM